MTSELRKRVKKEETRPDQLKTNSDDQNENKEDIDVNKEDIDIDVNKEDIQQEITKSSSSIESWVVVISIIVCFFSVKYLAYLKKSLKTKVMTTEELKNYDGNNGYPLYIAIIGEIYDVSENERIYGESGSYHFFTGKDASRSFVTGDFVNDLNDDVSDFNPEKCHGLLSWRNFYQNEKMYKFIGKVQGNFYDNCGNSKEALNEVFEKSTKFDIIKKLREESKLKYPNCNSRMVKDKGGSVWCKVGYPRLYTEIIPGDEPRKRCACFPDQEYSDIKQLYENCGPHHTKCNLSPK